VRRFYWSTAAIASACAMTFLLRDPRRADRGDRGDENSGPGPSTLMSA
jgi:hypothetical protein